MSSLRISSFSTPLLPPHLSPLPRSLVPSPPPPPRSRNTAGTLVAARPRRGAAARSSSSEVATALGGIAEVDKDSFWPAVEASTGKIVVLDMYTQWCGPCKVMAPKVRELSEKYLDVVFLKLDCNQENKPLAKELGVRVVPTFKILKGGKIVQEVTGAKFDELVSAIDSARSS